MATPTIQERLRKARLDLILEVPFFGTLAFRLKFVEDADEKTACTDGKHIRFSPDYVAKLTAPELCGLLVEEIGHCAYGHLFRRGGRDPKLWNQACDQVLWQTILDISQKTQLVRLSSDCQVHPDFKGMAAEEIYHLLKKDGGKPDYQSPGAFTDPAPAKGKKGGKGEKAGEGATGAGDNEPGESQSIAEEWQQATLAAAIVEAQRGRGTLPGYAQCVVDALKTPRVPWTDLAREFCHHLSRDDYSFARPNRRLLGYGFVLPSLRSETLGPIIGAFDTSGSIYSQRELVCSILSELQGVLDQCRPTELRLLSCDTRIKADSTYTPGDDLRTYAIRGGGGTDFRPVFELADSAPEPPACLIFLTDLEGTFPDEAPPYPVLWANFGHPHRKAPFGTTIHVAS